MKKIQTNSITKNPTNLLDGATTDHIEDRSMYFRSDDAVTWTGSELQFTEDIILEVVNTKTGTITTHTISTAQSPIVLADGESAYIEIDRSTSEANTIINSGVTPIPAQSSADNAVIILGRRIDSAGLGFLHIPLHKQVFESGQTARLGSLGAGSGSGEGINYITNSDGETSVVGYDTYDDGAVSSPVDGTGGSPSIVTFTKTSVVAEILRESGSFKFSKAAGDGQGEGTSFDFKVDPRDTESKLQIFFDHKNLDTNYVNGDMRIFIYDIDNAALLTGPLNGDDGDVLFHDGEGVSFLGEFTGTGAENYRLIFHNTSTNASVWAMSIDRVQVGPVDTFVVASDRNTIETKILSSDDSSNAVIPELTFSGLTIGKTYEVYGTMRI